MDPFKTLTTILKSIDKFLNTATTSSLITLSLTGIGTLAILISTATACRLSIGNKVLYEIIINKYNKYKETYEKTNKLLNFLTYLIKKALQDNLIDTIDLDSFCNVFSKRLEETKKVSFFTH